MDNELIDRINSVISLLVLRLGRIPSAPETREDLFARLRSGLATKASADLEQVRSALEVLRDLREPPQLDSCALCGGHGGGWRAQFYGGRDTVYFHYTGTVVCVRCAKCGQQTGDRPVGNELTRLRTLVSLVQDWNTRQARLLEAAGTSDCGPPADDPPRMNIGEAGKRRMQL